MVETTFVLSSRRRCKRLPGTGLLIAVLCALAPAAPAQQSPVTLQVGITGTNPPDERRDPTFMLRTQAVADLVMELATAPRDRGYVETAIAGNVFTVDDMVAVGLLRHQDGLYWIDFNLLTVADQQRIVEVAEARGRELGRMFLEHREAFEELAARHGVPESLRPQLFYIVLGCFSLDWDGLTITEDLGYRAGAQRTIDGYAFTPWAKEQGADISRQGLYWGSHNSPAAGFTVTTFGDHHSVPRFGLPDLLWDMGGAFGSHREVEGGRRAALRLLSAYAPDINADAAKVMVAVRHQTRTVEEIASATGVSDERIARLIELLSIAEYVEQGPHGYRSRIVVLEESDRELVSGLMRLGRTLMTAWHEANYDTVAAQLSDLTPVRNGVPFERVYTEVWHFVFGIANRTMVEAAWFADPYAPDRRHVGFLPAIWARGLDDVLAP